MNFGREATPEELANKLRMPLEKLERKFKRTSITRKPVRDEEDSSLEIL